MIQDCCRQRRLLLLVVSLIVISFLLIAIMYDIPRNFHRMLVRNHNSPKAFELTDRGTKDSNELYRDGQRQLNSQAFGNHNRPVTFADTGKSSSTNNPRELKQRLPNVIIIGSKKAGTRALLQFLGLHPQIKIAHQEIHFFDKHYRSGIDWYKEQMPTSYPNEITMEKTPGYFIHPKVPKRIKKTYLQESKNLKFLLILRDPVQRAISDYAQGIYQHKKANFDGRKNRLRSFEKKVFSDVQEREVDRSSYLIRVGLYAKYLKKWLKFFDLKQFHFISSEKFMEKPWQELNETQVFLNISIAIDKKSFWFNKTKHFYCIYQQKKNSTPSLTPKCLSEVKGRKHPYINASTILSLKRFYKPFNQELYRIVGRDFGW